MQTLIKKFYLSLFLLSPMLIAGATVNNAPSLPDDIDGLVAMLAKENLTTSLKIIIVGRILEFDSERIRRVALPQLRKFYKSTAEYRVLDEYFLAQKSFLQKSQEAEKEGGSVAENDPDAQTVERISRTQKELLGKVELTTAALSAGIKTGDAQAIAEMSFLMSSQSPSENHIAKVTKEFTDAAAPPSKEEETAKIGEKTFAEFVRNIEQLKASDVPQIRKALTLLEQNIETFVERESATEKAKAPEIFARLLSLSSAPELQEIRARCLRNVLTFFNEKSPEVAQPWLSFFKNVAASKGDDSNADMAAALYHEFAPVKN